MSDIINPYEKKDTVNPVETNTRTFVQGASNGATPPARRQEYTVRKPLELPKSYTQVSPARTVSAPAAFSAAGGDSTQGGEGKAPGQQEKEPAGDYWGAMDRRGAALEEIRARNVERYNLSLPDYEYEALNEHFKEVAKTDGLKAAEEERWRYTNAMQFSRMYDIPLETALANLDEYNTALFGRDTETAGWKGKAERLGDAWTQGVNSIRRSKLGKELMRAEASGDSETAKAARDAIAAIDRENELLAPNQPQGVGMAIVTAGLQYVPYTAYVGAAGFLSGMVGLGPLGGFAAGYDLMRADSYINLRQAGADTESARAVSAVSGALQAAVEQCLGMIADGAAIGVRIAGKKILSPLTKGAERTLADKVTKLAFSHFKLDGTMQRLLAGYGIRRAEGLFEEGAEEFVQQVIDGLSFHVANALSDSGVNADDIGKIARDSVEAFRGGIMGALFLGTFTAGVSSALDVRDYKALREAAETIPSKEAFKKATEHNRMFDGMSDEKRIAAQNAIYDSFESAREKDTEESAQEIAEVNADEEGLEPTVFDDEEGTQAEETARDEKGALFIDNKILKSDDNGLSEGVYRAGNPQRASDNGYAYIRYTLDENTDTVTIDRFATAYSRQGLRAEFFEDFARDFSDFNIEWTPKYSRAQAIKENLINANPRGASFGLNYFADSLDADAETRLNIAKQIQKEMPRLNTRERTLAMGVIESVINGGTLRDRNGRTFENITDWYNKTFRASMFGKQAELYKEALAKGVTDENGNAYAAGGMEWKYFENGVKAVVYAGEQHDITTLLHELAHVWRSQLSLETRREFEKVFNVPDGKWNAIDPRTGRSYEETFAETFDKFLSTGDAPTNALKSFFHELARFVSRMLHLMEANSYLSPEISAAYRKIFADDESVLAKAEKAVKEAEEAHKAEEKRASKEKRDSERKNKADKMPKQTTREHVRAKAQEIAESVIADPVATDGEKAGAVLDAAAMTTVDLGDFIFQTGRAEDGESARQMEAVRQQYQGTDGWMKAPNGKPTNLTERQWLQVRTPNFKRWFGDWEAGHKARQIIDDSPINLADNELSNLTGSEQRTKAAEIYNVLVGKEPVRTVDGRNVVFTRTGFKELKSHSANPHTLQIVPKLQEIISTATPFFSEKNTDQTKPNVKAFHSYARKILLSDGEYIARVVLREDNDGTIFYDGEATELQKVEELRQPDRKPNAGENLQTPLKNKVMQFFADVNSNDVSKVVDENGEPLVVYHGTKRNPFKQKFDIFNTKNSPAWFAAHKDYAAEYFSEKKVLQHGDLYSVFLNIKKPLAVGPINYGGTNTLEALAKQTGLSLDELKALSFDNTSWLWNVTNDGKFKTLAENKGFDGIVAEENGMTFATFEPAQIKSATDNTGAFDPHNPSILFQIAGEIGAARLDAADEETREGKSRMENLAVAKSMEAAGKDAQAIRLATGWEKGADGLWRWEIDDSHVRTDTDAGMMLWEAEHPDFNRLLEKVTDGTITAGEEQELSRLQEEYGKAYDMGLELSDSMRMKKQPRPFLLEQVLYYPELYKAYPEMKGVLVEVAEKSGTADGAYAPKENVIRLYRPASVDASLWEEQAKSTLLHEVQHAIQYIEGFATGGSPDKFSTVTKETLRKKKVDKLLAEAQAIFDKQSEDWKTKVRAFNRAQIADDLEEMRRIADELDAEAEKTKGTVFDDDFNDYVDLMAQAKDYNSGSRDYEFKELTPGEQYLSLAGETEARNVEARRKLTPMQRAQTLLALTEDVARDDQIVVMPAQKILFQTAYHGSGASFDRFNTEEYGLSGEGSMSFGWGTYLSGSEKIARGYAERQSGSSALVDKLTKKYPDAYAYITPIVNNMSTGQSFEEAKNSYISYWKENHIPGIRKMMQALKGLDGNDFAAELKRNLYTVDIPDGKYLVWDKTTPKALRTKIKNALFNFLIQGDYAGSEKYLKPELDDVFDVPLSGQETYNNLQAYLGSDRDTSLFLRDNGIVGMDYPAGTNFGNGDGARNYVIFNDDDIKITNHILFQTADIEAIKARALQVLDEKAEPMQQVEYTREEYNKLFPRGDVVSPIGKIKLGAHQFERLADKDGGTRKNFVGAMYQTLKKPLVIIEDIDEQGRKAKLFIKSFIGEKKRKSAFAVVVKQDSEEVSVSFGLRKEKQMQKKIKTASRFYYVAATDPTIGTAEALPNNKTLQQKDVTVNTFFENDGFFFQTRDELIESAQSFDSWNDFMEYYEAGREAGFLEPNEYSQIPAGAPSEWYKSVWENAHKMSETETNRLDAERAKALHEYENDSTPEVMDAMFTAMLSEPGALDHFLRHVNQILDEEINANPQDEEEVKENERLQNLKRFIRTQLRHGSFVTNAKRAAAGKPLTQRSKATIMTLIRRAPRDYRAIYAEIMDSDEWRVDEKDTVSAKLKAAGAYNIVAGEDINEASPETRRKIALRIKNEKIAESLKNGTFKIDSDLESYINSLKDEIKEADKRLETLDAEIKEDYQRMSDWQERRILELYDKLLLARSKYEPKSDSLARKAETAQNTAQKYKDNRYQNIKADYEKVFRQWQDLLKITRITEEVQAAIQRRDDKAKLQEKQKEKKEEKNAIEDLKAYRKQLVKRAMRRVPFERIDYQSAKTLIAIQRIFEPNLEGGVNKWIGTEGKWARAVWGAFQTDENERAHILSKLSYRRNGAALAKLLTETKTAEEFEAWTKKDRQKLYKALGSDNWVQKLNLIDLDKERENSIQLDIEEVEEHGEVTLRIGEDVQNMVADAIGVDMFEAIVNRPFAEWTTEDMEAFAKKIDELYVRGRNLRAAKKQAEKESAEFIRKRIQNAVRNTGIVINDDDTPEEKEAKQKKINKIFGYSGEVKGTAADKYKRHGIFNKLLHSYHDANIRRVARILDNYSEGTNTNLLYWRENDCYTREERSKERRQEKIASVMRDKNLSLAELFRQVTVKDFKGEGQDAHFTVDELLYYLMASRDTLSLEACKYGSMFDENEREVYKQMDKEAREAFIQRIKMRDEAMKKGDQEEANRLNGQDAEAIEDDGTGGLRLETPGTSAYKTACNERWEKVMDAAKELLNGEDGEKYKAFCLAIAEDYRSEFDRIQDVSIAEFGQPVNRVENYVPLIRLAYSGDTNENRVRADLMAMNADAQKMAGADKGFTQKRIEIGALNQRPVEAGLYATWADAVERTEHFIAYAGYVRELNRIYNSRDAGSLMQWIESRYGSGMTSYLKDYIQEVANPNRGQQQSALDKIVRTLRGKTAPAYLAWKASSIFKQALSSPAPFFQFVSIPEYVSACKDMITSYKETGEIIREKSVFMKNRRFDPIADLIDEEIKKSTGDKVQNMLDKIGSMGMQGLEWIDWACVAPGWLACYRKEYKRLKSEADAKRAENIQRLKVENAQKPLGEQLSDDEIGAQADFGVPEEDEIEKKAVLFADDKTRLCQPSNRKVDLAPMFKNGSEVQKALLQFTASLNVIWQNIWYDIPYAVKQHEVQQIIGMVAGYAAAGIALGLLAGSDDDDEDKSDTVRRFIHASTTQFTDAVPVIGAVTTSTAEKLITGKTSFSSGTDLFPTLTKYLTAVKEVSDAKWGKSAAHFAEGVGLTLGLPVSGAKEVLYVAGIGDGEDGLAFHPTALTGRRPGK